MSSQVPVPLQRPRMAEDTHIEKTDHRRLGASDTGGAVVLLPPNFPFSGPVRFRFLGRYCLLSQTSLWPFVVLRLLLQPESRKIIRLFV